MKRKRMVRIFGLCLCLPVILMLTINAFAAQDESSNLGMLIYTPEIADSNNTGSYQYCLTSYTTSVVYLSLPMKNTAGTTVGVTFKWRAALYDWH